jgi:undecaprenyl-diphosphatase
VSHLTDKILQLHGWLALAIVFAVPALESSAFLGFVFPGEVAVLLGGVLAFQGRVSLPAVIAAAVGGAVIGDSIGYEVGRHWGRRIIDSTVGRILKREHIDRAQRYLAERGGKAVFLGRFTAALRVFIPGLAGMSGMDYRTFATYNVAGGTVWATGFVLLGYAAGSSYRRVESVAKRASLILLLVLVVGVAIVVVARRVARNPDRYRAFARRQLARPRIARLRARYDRQLAFLARRFHREGALGLTLTFSLVVLAALGWAFGAVLQDVLSNELLNPVDRPVLRFFVRHREPWLTTVMKALTLLGSSALLIPLLVIVGLGWRWRRGTWRPLAVLAAAYGGAVALSQVVKVLVARPRPPAALAIGQFGGFAFPSGHATQATVAWGALAALAAAGASRWSARVGIGAGAVAIIVVVGISRLYLGAHWLTDVVGGFALGGLWLAALFAAIRAARAIGERGGPPEVQSRPEGHATTGERQ